MAADGSYVVIGPISKADHAAGCPESPSWRGVSYIEAGRVSYASGKDTSAST